MDIVLRDNLILIKTDFHTLNTPWMREFLELHTRGMLFLPKAVLIFRNDSLSESRKEFVHRLSAHHAKVHDFKQEFFLRSMLKFAAQPIRIELNSVEEPEIVKANLYAYDKNTVLITLEKPNIWVMNYFRSQLEAYSERGTDRSLVVDVSDFRLKEHLERTLNKRHILHYQIQYSFDNKFISKLYSDFARYSFGDLVKENAIEEKKRFYTILECPVGASQDALKKSYKKLVQVYHPDKVYKEKPYMIEYYTNKFQLLQEAYEALRIVS